MSHFRFKNIEVIDPYVEKGWSSEVRLTHSNNEEVDFLESELGEFPVGYRDYVTTLGRGEYCSYIRVNMPREVLDGYAEYQKFIDEYWFWEMSEETIPKDYALSSVYFASTIDGDAIFFHPDAIDEIFVLPRNDDKGHIIGTNLYEAIDWLCVSRHDTKSGSIGEEHVERYFVPYNPWAYEHGHIVPERYRRY